MEDLTFDLEDRDSIINGALEKYKPLIQVLENNNFTYSNLSTSTVYYELRNFEIRYTSNDKRNYITLWFKVLPNRATPKLDKFIFNEPIRMGEWIACHSKIFNSVRRILDRGEIVNDDSSKIELLFLMHLSNQINRPRMNKWNDDTYAKLTLSYFTKPPSNYFYAGYVLAETITIYNSEYDKYLTKLYICWAFSQLKICKDLWKMFFEIMLFGKKDE